jgi:hypothetical protein
MARGRRKNGGAALAGAGTGLARRLLAFVAERHPLALDAAQGAAAALVGLPHERAACAAALEVLRPALAGGLRKALGRAAPA